MKDKERDRLYGQIVIDFANAKTTDEACFRHFRNIHKLKKFPSDFPDRAKGSFPSRASLKLQDELETLFPGLMQSVREALHNGGSDIERECEKTLRDIPCPRCWRPLPCGCGFGDNGLLVVGDTLLFHHRVSDIQRECREILKEISRGKPLDEVANFLRWLFDYNGIQRSWLELVNNHLVELPPSVQEDKYIVPERVKRFPASRLLGQCREDLVYCLFEFLKSGNLSSTGSNRDLIRECVRCGNFYIAEKVDRRNKYCPDCRGKKSPEYRKAYMEKWRIRSKKQRESEKFEAEIGDLMERLNISREEAIEVVKDDAQL